MKNSLMSPTVEMPAGDDTSFYSSIKQQWKSITSIESVHPVDWLNVKHIGKATYFTSSYAVHRLKIIFPLSGLIRGNYGFITQIVLNFSTTGKAAIASVELYEGKYLQWINRRLALHGDHRFTLPSDHFWEIDPGLPFTENLRLELVVSFGAPNIEIPEFCFHAAHIRLAF